MSTCSKEPSGCHVCAWILWLQEWKHRLSGLLKKQARNGGCPAQADGGKQENMSSVLEIKLEVLNVRYKNKCS